LNVQHPTQIHTLSLPRRSSDLTVASSKGGVSNAPKGPFHTSVRQVLSTSARASVACGPMSRIISSAATSWTLQVRTEGGLAANRSEEHTSELQSRENLVCRLLL